MKVANFARGPITSERGAETDAPPRKDPAQGTAARTALGGCPHSAEPATTIEQAYLAGAVSRLRWTSQSLAVAKLRATEGNLSLEDAIRADRRFDPSSWTRALAGASGLPWLRTIHADRLVIDHDATRRLALRQSAQNDDQCHDYRMPDGTFLRLVPDRIAAAARAPGGETGRLCLVPAAALRQAVLTRLSPRAVAEATDRLFLRSPELSARWTVNAWQAFTLGVLAVLLPLGLLHPGLTVAILHAVSSLFFLGVVALRLFALPHAGSRATKVKAPDQRDLPVYSVLVALHHEAHMIPQLVTALGRLRWPRDKLEIKLVCEADDRATIEAIEILNLPPFVEIIRVPSRGPRTKPKALAFAMQFCRGDLVCLFDAEDRPHPDQLLDAWQTFGRSGPKVASLQAPLVVTNGGAGWLARQFALEYAALFRGLLPALAARHSVLPLGGTSNHFRRAAIEAVGGWDPYNVTEDADLGIRLCRAGYRTRMIDAPTLEDAPVRWRDWLPQRTRWMKGWMVSWIVHNRQPLQLLRELGPRDFIVAQILLAGIPGAALLLPFALLSAIAVLLLSHLGWFEMTTGKTVLLILDGTMFAVCIAVQLVLGARGGGPAAGALWSLPFYWCAQSVAAWRAVFQLVRQKSHLWEKTPHMPSRAWRTAIPPIARSATAHREDARNQEDRHDDHRTDEKVGHEAGKRLRAVAPRPFHQLDRTVDHLKRGDAEIGHEDADDEGDDGKTDEHPKWRIAKKAPDAVHGLRAPAGI